MDRAIFNALYRWKEQEGRMPLLLRGARQVGKTTAIEMFARLYFSSFVNINFELQPKFKVCFDNLEPSVIVNSIATLSQQGITPGETLLFLDEVQECPQAIMSLRYFKEKMPELHVVAAGSLLEFALREESIKMPVGRVESLYLKPVSFSEYLMVRGYSQLKGYYSSLRVGETPNQAFDAQAGTLLREYFVTGGMPDVVDHFVRTGDLQRCQIMQAAILSTYRNDFGKYARSSQHKYLQRMFEKAPGMVAQHFKYAKIDPHMQSRDLKAAMRDLVDAGLIYPVVCTSASGLPLNAYVNEKRFKVLFLDIGLVKQTSYLSSEIMMQKDLMLINQGALVEQFVGQELLAYMPSYLPGQLFYWQREKPGALAEVDYVIQVGDQIIPIEVKAGKTGSLKSLNVFLEKKSSPFGVRISMKPLSFKNNILSVPLYMLFELERIIEEQLEH